MKYFCKFCGKPLEKAYLARGLCEDCWDAEVEEEEEKQETVEEEVEEQD